MINPNSTNLWAQKIPQEYFYSSFIKYKLIKLMIRRNKKYNI